jgi:uncharacterized membrane protein YgdD (TMEM256/DUF423 family)
MKFNLWFFLAGTFGLTALILDAFGTHALPSRLALSPEAMNLVKQSWQTAIKYQLVHALLLLFFAHMALERKQWNLTLGKVFTVLGVFLFCGGIYTKILIGCACVGKIAPYGGSCFMLAWVCLMVTAFRLRHK